jgi:hypothetical protein
MLMLNKFAKLVLTRARGAIVARMSAIAASKPQACLTYLRVPVMPLVQRAFSFRRPLGLAKSALETARLVFHKANA